MGGSLHPTFPNERQRGLGSLATKASPRLPPSHPPLRPSHTGFKMVRKIPTQVPQQMSRMLESRLVKQPPTWWGAVLANPPPVLPPRQVTPRNRPDAMLKQFPDLEESHFAQHHSRPKSKNHKQKHLKEIKPKPVEISYPIDKIRRQFFADFPFEALRPTSITEGIDIAAENPIQGKNWTKLVLRGRYPTVEDTIQFAHKLHTEDGMALQLAYDEAVSQFCQLRAHHEMASQAAETEARHYGAKFKRDEWVSICPPSNSCATVVEEANPRPARSTGSVARSRARRSSSLTTPTPPPATRVSSGSVSRRSGPATSLPPLFLSASSLAPRRTSRNGLSLPRRAGPERTPRRPRETSSSSSAARPAPRPRRRPATRWTTPSSWRLSRGSSRQYIMHHSSFLDTVRALFCLARWSSAHSAMT